MLGDFWPRIEKFICFLRPASQANVWAIELIEPLLEVSGESFVLKHGLKEEEHLRPLLQGEGGVCCLKRQNSRTSCARQYSIIGRPEHTGVKESSDLRKHRFYPLIETRAFRNQLLSSRKEEGLNFNWTSSQWMLLKFLPAEDTIWIKGAFVLIAWNYLLPRFEAREEYFCFLSFFCCVSLVCQSV